MLASEKNNSKLRVAIIISLNNNEGKAFYNGQNYDVSKRVEKEFLKYLDKDAFELVVIKNATLETVWRTLHDRSIYGAFFLGHAAVEANTTSPITAPSLIADQNLYNIKNVFQSVHSNLRYLALISCNAKEILQGFINKGYYDNAPELKVMAFDKKIGLAEGVRDVLFDQSNPLVKHEGDNKLFHRKLKINPDVFNETYIEPIAENNFQLKRILPIQAAQENVQSTLVLANNRVVAFFNSGNPGTTQTINIQLFDSELNNKISLVNDSGAPSTRLKSNTILGELKILPTFNYCELKGLKNSQGELMGIGKNIYDLNCQ